MNESHLITTDVELAARILNTGGVVGMPTETVYGLAARADFEESVGRIFDIKGRPRNHPLIAHLSTQVDPTAWGQFNNNAIALASAFWPGPITLLVPRTNRIGAWVTGGRDSVALRVPAHAMTQSLLSQVEDAVVAPSANLFGKVSPTTAPHVLHDLGDQVDVILDGGPCAIGVESTIVECVGDSVSVLRPGGISAAHIAEVTGLQLRMSQGESRAPGMLLSHYAPTAQVQLVATVDEAKYRAHELNLDASQWTLLHFDDNEEYALKMYDSLRQFDAEGVEYIFATIPNAHGIGEAIRDRLYKAAAPKD